MFVFFSILDVRHRKIKLYWFVIAILSVTAYKMIFEFDAIGIDLLSLAISAIFVFIAYVTRLFAEADLLGILILSFAVPYTGPFPTGISVLIGTLIIQSHVIIFSNLAYNISDIGRHRCLFDDVPQVRNSRLKSIYWHFMARRRRDRDGFVLSAEKMASDSSNARMLSIKRNNKLCDDTKYVYSAYPQFVFTTAVFCFLQLLSLGM